MVCGGAQAFNGYALECKTEEVERCHQRRRRQESDFMSNTDIDYTRNRRSLHGMARPRGGMSIALLAAMGAMMGMGGAGISAPPVVHPPEPEPEPSKHDEERLRLAVERRKRRAEKKAENERRTKAGKRPSAV